MAKALLFLAAGLEEIEALTVVGILRRADVDVTVEITQVKGKVARLKPPLSTS